MEIKEIPIEQLKPAEYNPRMMTEKQVKDLTESIKHFGLVDPIIVNQHEGRENIVVGGHQRLKIASNLGFKTIPVVYVNLAEKEERELNLRLNKNLGEWDWDLLANFEIEELKDVGFNDEELDKFLDLKEDNFDAQAEYDNILEPVSKLGDLWQLGEHRLLCGDSTQKASYEAILGQKMASMVFTDPPYNVGYDYRPFRGRKRDKLTTPPIFNDKKTDKDFQGFIKKVMELCYEFSENYTPFYLWFASKNEIYVREAIEKAKWHIAQTIIWLKDRIMFSPGQDYHRIYEPCYFGWKNKEKHYKNKDYGNWSELILLDYENFESLMNVIYSKRDNILNYIHPTQKPIRLAERALKKHSNQGDIVLEPFNGSGSTMIACEQLKRKCYAIELDPKYVDVAIKRWEQFTNQKAIKI